MKALYKPFLVTFLLFLAVVPAIGSAADIFTVNDVTVAGDGKSAVEAKNNAIAKGQEEAFKSLLEKITQSSSNTSWPALSSDEIADLVRSFDIKEEKITATHYQAVLNISFNRALVENLLQKSSVSYVTENSRATVLLPLFKKDGEVMLWQDSQPWKAAWKNNIKQSSFLSLVIPSGDEKDIAALEAAKLAQDGYAPDNADKKGIEALMRKYRAQRVLLVKAEQSGQTAEINVEISYISEFNPKVIKKTYAPQANTDTLEIVMNGAVADVIATVEGGVKSNMDAAGDVKESLINVTIPVNNMEEWSAIYRDLGRLGFIGSVKLKYITSKYISADIVYKVPSEELIGNFAASGFNLAAVENGAFLTRGLQ